MMTSDSSWSARLRAIGDLERADHYYLTPEDNCAFFGEYTPRAGFGHSSTNDIVLNLKKPPSVREQWQWKWKLKAIAEVGKVIAANLKPDEIRRTTFVPIPPSNCPGDPDYDDRMSQAARAIGGGVDVRELLYTAANREKWHLASTKRDPVALRQGLRVQHHLIEPAAEQVILLDDVLTTGCSFRVCSEIISSVWPSASVYGIFVARRIIERQSLFPEII